jgi:hypothetical protein
MTEMSSYLPGVGIQCPRGSSSAQHPKLNHPNDCTRAMLKFDLYAEYKSHNDAALSYMEDALHRIHTFQD